VLALPLFTLPLACGGEAASAPPVSTATNSATTPSAASAVAPTGAIGTAGEGSLDAKIRTSLAGPQRTDAAKARDKYRHPAETLESFGLEPNMTVIELNPGGGWYTAVLAPVLRDQGKLVVVGGDPKGDPKSEMTQDAIALQARFQKTPDAFGKVAVVVLTRDQPFVYGAPESADMVLTFRNLHNWIEAKMTDQILGAAFKVLKHGGVLGLTDHRAKVGASTNPKVIGDTGYIPEAEAIRIVEAAGFKLAGKSEVNANPKDTKDYPRGVWTLPPTFVLKDVDHAKYEAIGESDRMTLKFVKP